MKHSVLICCLACTFISCEKIVTIPLPATPSVLTVAGYINSGGMDVYLNYVTPYYASQNKPEFNAVVIVSTDTTRSDTLLPRVSSSNGNYHKTISGPMGKNYRLFIKTPDGLTYEATSVMPTAVLIDTVTFTYDASTHDYAVTCWFTDPPAPGNYYKISGYTSYKVLDKHKIILLTDVLTNGQKMSYTFEKHITYGTWTSVTLTCIDKGTYDFNLTLPDYSEDYDKVLVSPPANPKSSISNGAIGFFSANTQSFYEGVAK